MAWLAHDPTRAAHRGQYASLVLAHDDAQLAAARASVERLSASLGGRPLATRIEPLKRFWIAENYHQKYGLRQDRVLMADFRAMFGDDDMAFVNSTATARVNGYVSGYGTKAQLEAELESLGLSDAGRARLISRVKDSGPVGACGI